MLDAGDLRSLRYQLARTLSYLSGTARHLIQERIEELSLENARLREMISEQRTRLEAGLETSQESEKERAEDVEKEENMLEKFNSASNRVFVIMPFKDDFSDVWNGGIRRACQETKFAPLRVDEIKMSSGITDDIKLYMKKSNTVIVDITGNNPNVMYEFGYSLGKGKDPIILCQKQESDKIPFDISGMRYLGYEDSWQGIEDLTKGLKKYLEETLKQRKKRRVRTHKQRSQPAS